MPTNPRNVRKFADHNKTLLNSLLHAIAKSGKINTIDAIIIDDNLGMKFTKGSLKIFVS